MLALNIEQQNKLMALKENMIVDTNEYKNKHIDNKINKNNNEFLHSNVNRGVTMNKINSSKNIIEDLQWGDVLYVDLDNYGVGSEQKGIRYAIVVQNDIGNKYSPTIIVALVTSQINKAKLPLIHVEIQSGKFGFPKDSVVLLEQLRTLDKRRIIRRVGRLDEITSIKIERALGNSTARKLEKKTPLERLPDYMRNEIINRLKSIKTLELTISTMYLNKIDNKSINLIENRMDERIDGLKYYCKINNIEFDQIYEESIEMTELLAL